MIKELKTIMVSALATGLTLPSSGQIPIMLVARGDRFTRPGVSHQEIYLRIDRAGNAQWSKIPFPVASANRAAKAAYDESTAKEKADASAADAAAHPDDNAAKTSADADAKALVAADAATKAADVVADREEAAFECSRTGKPHLHRGSLTRLTIAYPGEYGLTFNGGNIDYATEKQTLVESRGALPPGEREDQYYFTPLGDDYQISAKLAVGNPADEKDLATREIDYVDLMPVDFGLLQSFKASYSVGFIFSSLRDSSYYVKPDDDTSGTITRGRRDSLAPKALALLHLNVYKQGDFLAGPVIGAVTNASGDAGFFAGLSLVYGKSERWALSVGYEWSKVARLNDGLFDGQTSVPNDTKLMNSVTRRSPLTIGISYNFSLTHS